MAELESQASASYYDTHPIFGDRSINMLGSIRPIPPLEVRVRETALRVVEANRVAPLLYEILREAGLQVEKIRLTGSVASGFSGPESDIDFEVFLVGQPPAELNQSYFEKQAALNRLVYQAIEDKKLRETLPFRLDLHLATSHRSEAFVQHCSSEPFEEYD